MFSKGESKSFAFVVCALKKCELFIGTKLKLNFENNIKGWVPKNSIFGVKKNEEI